MKISRPPAMAKGPGVSTTFHFIAHLANILIIKNVYGFCKPISKKIY